MYLTISTIYLVLGNIKSENEFFYDANLYFQQQLYTSQTANVLLWHSCKKIGHMAPLV